MRRHGIFCLEEADWWLNLREASTVVSVLEFLHQAPMIVPFIRGDVGTKQELAYYLDKWNQRGYRDYRILYLAFHGRPGVIYVGDQRRGRVTLEEMAESLEGSARGRIVHFGSCDTLGVDSSRIKTFLQRTKAVAVCGYKARADWITAAGFELLLLSELQENALTAAGMRAVKRRIQSKAAGLVRDLNFRMMVRPPR